MLKNERELVSRRGSADSFLELGGRTEGERKEEERRKREQHSEDCHPEVSNEAFPEERKFLFFSCWIEVEEESAERELEQNA